MESTEKTKAAVPAIQFSPVQQQVIESRGKNLLVSASAGAGKTAVLVERLCRLVLEDHVSIDSILAVTFTEDAAAEMKERLKARLKQFDDGRDPWIRTQLNLLETASISTIHGFCLSLVQSYYYLIPISYSMASTIDTGIADEQALSAAYRQALEGLGVEQGAALRLYFSAYSKSERDLQAMILRFLEMARSKPDPKAWMNECRQEPAGALLDEWFFRYFTMRLEAMKALCLQMEEAIGLMEFAKIKARDDALAVFDSKKRDIEQCLYLAARRDYPALRAQLLHLIEQTGKFMRSVNKVSFEDEQSTWKQLESEILSVLFEEAQFAQFADQEAGIRQAFVDLAIGTEQAFSAIKEQEQFIDFSDMEHFAWKLLQNPAVRQELREKYQVILVDEYQDTNDLQEAILSSFARDNNVFRVGDIKQSIYGFRQARPDIMKQYLEHPGKHDEVIHMRENYRSSDLLIRFNNTFYQRLMNFKGCTPQFSGDDAAIAGTAAQKEQPQVPVRFLYSVYSEANPADYGVDARGIKGVFKRARADMIAADIEEKVKSGQARMRDIAILSRASTPHEELKEALEARGIRSISHVKKGFYTNKSVQIVLSALRLIENRSNDIALMSVLCSPLSGYDEKKVLPYAAGKESSESLFHHLRHNDGAFLLDVYWDLKKFEKMPFGEMVRSIYNYRDFYNAATTSQDKTNLDLLLEKAVEAQSTMDLSAFLESTGLEENLNRTSEAIPFGREEDAVRIGTIHSSKGLQYKIVYLLSDEGGRDMEAGSPLHMDLDLGLSMGSLDQEHWLRRPTKAQIAFEAKRFASDQEEKMRLLYVATTRAREQLVIVDTIRSEKPYENGLGPLALYRNKGFTSWFFHAFFSHRVPEVVFEKLETLPSRPEGRKEYSVRYHVPQYEGPVREIRSRTASKLKKSLQWRAASALLSSQDTAGNKGKERGTLFHEMAEQLPYPYQKEPAAAFAARRGMELDERDLQQFLSLNDCAKYAEWMRQKHVFECPYAVMEGEQLVHGYMDMVVWNEQGISILDFKTDNAFSMESLVSYYRSQLETYRDAMKKIEPGVPVHLYLYSFSFGELAELENRP